MASGVDGLGGSAAALLDGVDPEGDLDAERFLVAFGIGASTGNKPSSTDIAIALGIESQLLPVGEIHFLRCRFCRTSTDDMVRSRDIATQTNSFYALRSYIQLHCPSFW
jgi:hypothetical protein